MKPPRLLYRKVARLGTLQDLVHIARRPPKQVVIIRRIGDQSAGLDVLAGSIDGGQFVLDRELRDAAALGHQKSVRRHQESAEFGLAILYMRHVLEALRKLAARSYIAIGESSVIDVRFGALCGLNSNIFRGPSCAKKRHMHRSKQHPYSITSSAVAST